MADRLFSLISSLAALGHVEILNARGEFACNSSSSHSIIVLPEGETLSNEEYTQGEYGWDNFTLTDSTSKVRYLAAMLSSRGEKLLAQELRSSLEEWSSGDYVDHQSVLDFPTDRFRATNEEFISELAALLARPEVAVLGGNDNEDGHPYMEANPPVSTITLSTYGGWIARKDEVDGVSWWVLFNPSDGTKLRLRMDPEVIREQGTAFRPEKSPAPELVDVKLTNRCAFERDCQWCYAGSVTDGAEADPVHVMNLIAALAELEVFEIAFGGGEPTLWPHFEETLRFARSVGVTPNFTTKNFTILTRSPHLLDLVGSVAFSVNDTKSLAKIDKSFSSLDWRQRDKVSIQLVPEVVSTKDLEAILDWAEDHDVRVTLLGYKTSGRGLDFSARFKRPDGFWIPLVKERRLRVAIDTVLAASSQGQLDAADVPRWCYHTEEGKSSLFVDAVTNTQAPSSYSSDGLAPLDLSAPPAQIVHEVRSAFLTY